MTPLGGTMHT